ncbi:related to EPT1-sn-1,2-diacylglycerol ethanolamine-and cholinephosphotransferase [Sporisorium reilianum f. sp. reilianum]|uniref:Related to EPT1-sn-1,2-diacylglycerol ethanolamine-and cholinephosphotransferase n=1 Tax=Sporisorium reilianum f. sp. reilianum TaxID=72559 RepID=A0A2N8U8X5_9BASI|nr:related to EPT1-sn-1,2-diacylglycerol ethanolamine-and cholinephosphotransferase [Sporisorium reilianum f. sp. reilianum]
MFDYIPASRIQNLHSYKYSGTDKSLVSKYILGPYWNWLVTLFPTSVAPNTITLSGLLLVCINFATLAYVDPGLQCATQLKLDPAAHTAALHAAFPADRSLLPVNPLFADFAIPGAAAKIDFAPTAHVAGRCLPPWVFYTWALCLFAYQSLDAIDGKQARRTGMAGPLGEMFDHGCDAINTTLECVLCCAALNLGRSVWAPVSLVATLSNFYLTTWEEYHTGTLFLSAFSGPVEGILMIVLIYALTGVVGGPLFWDRGLLNVTGLSKLDVVRTHASRLNLPLNDAFLAFALLGLLANIVGSYSNVVAARRARNQSALTPLLGLTPLVVQITANCAWLRANRAFILADPRALLPFLAFWGLSFAYNVGLLIVAHVTKAPFPYWNAAIVWSVLLALDANAVAPWVQTSPERQLVVIWVSLAGAALVYVHFCVNVVTTITEELGMACFVVRPPTKLKPPRKGE